MLLGLSLKYLKGWQPLNTGITAMCLVISHQAVLLKEAIQALRIRADGVYLDGTFGRGGHTDAILKRLGSSGRLLALDQDPEARCCAQDRFQADARFCFEQTNFIHLAKLVDKHQLQGGIQGILLDIGVSSPQLEDPARGFSFTHEGPLDMRMDPNTGMSAGQWLAIAEEANIDQVLKELGEERFHRRIARAIVETRRLTPINTTLQLARIIAAAVPTRERGKHPATRSFQAIRIFINKELEALKLALLQGLDVLAPGGRLVVISFHSLEDRIVKRFMREQARGRELPLDLPVPAAQIDAKLRLIGKVIRPTAAEIQQNPRARSAVMRVAERLS